MESGFLPIIPSQIDPRPAVSDDSHLSPIFAEQNFFSSFFRSGHHHLSAARPFSSNQYFGGSSNGRFASSTRAPLDDSILGSGDFSVLRGGTFYADGDTRRRPSQDYFGGGSSFYESANSGRPFALPLESPHYSDDPFANFKDFADITASIDADFSHVVAVYAKKNSTAVKHEPNNILEQLQLIDEEKRSEEAKIKRAEVSTAEPIKVTKLSKFKTKLLSTKEPKQKKKETPKKKSAASSSVDYIDPLLAESYIVMNHLNRFKTSKS